MVVFAVAHNFLAFVYLLLSNSKENFTADKHDTDPSFAGDFNHGTFVFRSIYKTATTAHLLERRGILFFEYCPVSLANM
jgi:hypothetical protein